MNAPHPRSAHIDSVAVAAERPDCYVYYRVRVERAETLRSRVTDMQVRLQQQYAISGTLKRRPQAGDGCHTWMEVYAAVPQHFDALLDAAAASAGLPELIDGERHAEYFLDMQSCG